MGACLYVQKISNFTASDATTSEQRILDIYYLISVS